MDTPITFRPAVPNDAQSLVTLINAMAKADNFPELDIDAQHRLIRDAFEKKHYQVVIAEWQDVVAGFATFFQGYSTFEARPTIFIDDLFVKNEFRGRHVAYELFRYLLREAKQRQCGRVEWRVIKNNEQAFAFYDRLKAKQLEDWVHYRLNYDDIQRLG